MKKLTQEYKDLKFKWYSLKRKGKFIEADKVKQELKLWIKKQKQK